MSAALARVPLSSLTGGLLSSKRCWLSWCGFLRGLKGLVAVSPSSCGELMLWILRFALAASMFALRSP